MPKAPQVSPDGKFYWTGRRWEHMPTETSLLGPNGRPLASVTKALEIVPAVGGNPNPQIEQSMLEQGMGYQRPFSPGRPLNPYFGFSADPRQFDFMTGENITARPRHNRISFDTLRTMTSQYDVARMCIARRIDSFRSFQYAIVPEDGYQSSDMREAIYEARKRIAKPDGRTPFKSWIAMHLENLFRYDAPAVFRRRNRGGQVIGIEIVDGSTIAPLLDEFGRPPAPPAPAFMQFANGVPWDWLTTEDLIYLPYRPQPDSPYGRAPLEDILLTANTDLRLQMHLLEQWTKGSIPGGFMEAPEDMSSPAEVEEFQDTWDADVEGDQEKKVQVRWVPHGANFKPSLDGKFDDPLARWLMRKTCAAYMIMPQDLGLTEDVNRATGETQVDIQERISDRPLADHLDTLMTSYLQEDCGLPVKVVTSLSAEKEDRKTEAEAWKIYIETGMASADEGRQKLLGLEVDNERPVPRFILNPRTGPIPLASIMTIAGPIDPETAAPSEDQPLDTKQFAGAPGTLADKLPGDPAFQRAPVDPDDPNFPQNEKVRPETGTITPPAQATAPTAAAAPAVPPAPTAVRKDANKGLLAAGLVVRAADTGRVLMLQRSLNETDPAAGTWEWPGGHVEGDESAWEAACREWQEETGSLLPAGDQLGSWTTGVYRGFLLEIPRESDVQINQEAGRVINPDDPDGDSIETVAWFDPAHVGDMPALRPECKTTDWDLVMGSGGAQTAVDKAAATEGVTSATGMVGYNGSDPLDKERSGDAELEDGIGEALDGYLELEEDVIKELRRWRDSSRKRIRAGKKPRQFVSTVIPQPIYQGVWKALEKASTRQEVDAAFRGRPKVRKAKSARPFIEQIQKAEAHFTAPLTQALRLGFDPGDLAEGWLARVKKAADASKQALTYVKSLEPDSTLLQQAVEAMYGAGHVIGAAEAVDVLKKGGVEPTSRELDAQVAQIDWSKWTPGDHEAAAALADLEGSACLQELLDDAGPRVASMTETQLEQLTGILADAADDGATVDELEAEIAAFFDDPESAELIATTELNRAVTTCTLMTYGANDIDEFTVLVYDPCPICADQEAQNPHALDEDAPPFHPRCRCAVTPVLSE